MWKRILAVGLMAVVGLALLSGSLYVAFRPNVAVAQDELDHGCSGECLAGEGQGDGWRGNGSAGCSGECLQGTEAEGACGHGYGLSGDGEHVCSGECLGNGAGDSECLGNSECDGECLGEPTQQQLRLRDGTGTSTGQSFGRGAMMRGRVTR